MHPVLFEIPGIGFPLRTFGVLVAAGFLLAVWLWGRLLAVYGRDPENDPARGSQVGVWILIGVLGGARLAYVGVEVSRYLVSDRTEAMETYLAADDRARAAFELGPEHADELEVARRLTVGYDLAHDPIQVLFLWRGGLVMYGGFLGAILLGAWASRRVGLDPWNAVDTGLICGFFGQAVGRWGCLGVGDDHGSVVPERFADLPFPITVRVPELEWLQANPESLFDHALAGQVLWATQPWMSLNALMVACVGLFVLRRRRWVGQVTAVVVMHYAVTRFAIEAFRGDEVRGVWFDGALSTSQLLSIPGLLFGIWMYVKRTGSGEPPVPRRADASAGSAA